MDMASPPNENPEYTGTRAHNLPGPATIISGLGASIQQWTEVHINSKSTKLI